MPTCAQIIDETIAMLHGYGSTQDLVTPLTTGIGATDTSFTVDFTFGQSAGMTPGVVEIDSEQLYVTNVDQTSGTCQLARGFGRGFLGTTPAAHAAGALIKSQPRFPRIWVFDQVNDIINDVYPDLFVVNKFTTVVTWPNNTYTLPVTPPGDILAVQWQDPLNRWQNVRSYQFDAYDGTFRLGGSAMIGRPLRILYTSHPSKFASETDDFAGVTGLPATSYDVLILGVASRQVPGLDISRAQGDTMEQSDRSRIVPPNAGINAGKFLFSMYQERLKNEARTLRNLYKPRLVKVWQ